MRGLLARPLAPPPSARLPYPDPLTEEEHHAVVEALRVALTATLAEADLTRPLQEVTVTHRLQHRLNAMLNEGQPVSAFNCRVFETVVVGNEMRNAAGTAQEKRPDLTVRRGGPHPVGFDRGDNALFIECKVIDAERLMGEYVPKGLGRFVDGTYAHAVPVGLMVGYVDGPFTLPQRLQQYLRRRDCPVPFRALHAPREAGGLTVTVHPRGWTYPDGGAPGDIHVGHLWVAAL